MKRLFLIILLAFSFASQSQFYSLSGYVYGPDNQPIPYVNIFIKNSDQVATTDLKGRYFFDLRGGSYEMIFKMLGYEDRELSITITKNAVKNIWMNESAQALDEVVIKVSKKDPAYDIIKKVIENKARYLNQYEGLTTNFYIKATEIQELDSAKLKPKDFVKTEKVEDQRTKMNLVEVKGKLHTQQPNKVKEIIDGYSVKGSERELFFLSNTEANFNFYNNLIYTSLTEAPLISPLNWTSVMSYKFKLRETYESEGSLIYLIDITPRKNGTALFEGEIHIVDDKWSIKKVDLDINKKSMNYYSKFRVSQEYISLNDSLWILSVQDFNYETKSSKTLFKGRTVVYYDSIEINPEFKKRFFGVELGVKTEKAYDRDSSYWNLKRPEPLTLEEQQHIAYVDSVEGMRNSDWYKDSVEREANKVSIKNILWFGQDYVNWRKKRTMYFAPVANMFDPVSPGGFRIGYYVTYSKKFEESKRSVRVVPSFTYGINNEDLKGSLSARFMYDPYHIRQVYGVGGRSFNLINPYDAYIRMFRRSNFFEQDFAVLGHRMELINGLYLNTSGEFADRRSIAGYNFVLNGDNQLFNDDSVIVFNPYKSLSFTVGMDFTPRQKFIKEPNEKIVLGSKWPTFGVNYIKGVTGLLGSSVDFDKIEFSLDHQHRLGVLGTTRWELETGKFLTRDNLKAVDFKYMRSGDPILYTNPYSTFQLLPLTFPVYDWYFEWHHLHHFNGVIMNKLPFLRKLNLRFVAGSGVLYVLDNNVRHIEIFTGVERVFRFWRERFRLGIYYAVGESSPMNYGNASYPGGFPNTIKFSIEYFDKQSEQWNF